MVKFEMIGFKWRLWVACLTYLVVQVEPSQELIKKMSTSFLKILQECKKELSVPDEILKSLMRFWDEDADLSHRELGCVILCMVTKQDLVELEAYKLHPEKAIDFAKKHGADDETAKQVISLLQSCENRHEVNTDHCDRMREVAKCFHGHMHELKWAPAMDVIIGELMATAGS